MQSEAADGKRLELARARRWFIDLEQGAADAASLSPEVREKLRWATVDIAADFTLSERRAREAAELVRVREQREARATSPATTRARTFSRAVLGAYVLTGITVLIPWLIGLNGFRDSWFRQRWSLVYSSSNRDIGDYFLTDYVTGLAVLSIGTGIVVGMASLVHVGTSKMRLALAVGLVVSAFAYWIPSATSAWDAAELATARVEASTVPSSSGGCGQYFSKWGSASIVLPGAGGIDHTWTVRPVADQDEDCTHVAVWDGVRFVRTVETPNIIGGVIAAFAGNSPEDSYVVFAAADPVPDCESSWCQPQYEVVGGFGLNDTEVAWQHTWRLTFGASYGRYTGHPLVVATADSFYAIEEPQTMSSRLLAFDLETGNVVWKTACPSAAPLMSRLGAPTDERGIFLQCNETGLGHRQFAVSTDGTLTEWASE